MPYVVRYGDGMTCFGFFDQSLVCQLTAGIILIFIWAGPDRVKSAQCPNCIGEIKQIDAAGNCHSCFPCPQCIDDYTTSSVPCGSTVPLEEDISCILIQLDPKASSQTRSLTSSPVIVTSIAHPLVIAATSSFVSAGPSIAQSEVFRSTKKPKTEKVFPSSNYSKWLKHPTIFYIFIAVALLVIFGAIAYRCKKVRDKDQRQLRVNPNQQAATISVQSSPYVEENETVNINFTTKKAVFSRTPPCDNTCGMGNQSFSGAVAHFLDGSTHLPTRSSVVDNRNPGLTKPPNTSSQPDKTTRDSHSQNDQNTSFVNCVLVQGHMIVQPGSAYNQPFPAVSWPQSLVEIVKNDPITHGLDQQGRMAVNWSALSQDEKYSTKILEMPYKLLYSISLSLDLTRADGNDNRALADKLGLTVPQFELLKQAAITQNPGDPVTYILLKERFYSAKPGGTVGDFVDILKEIGREDIVRDINNWSDMH